MARGGVVGRRTAAAYVRRTSLNRGLLDGDRLWRTVFFVVMGRKLVRKVMGSEPEIVSVEKLKPGQFVGVTAISPRSLKGQSKRRNRAGKRA